ncbi:CPBP family intramembrane metalloprotease [Saccharopolyspora erythraea]|nr:CPBP family intramembrane metalloprotease [Saccharopolyspora erythraea]
MLPARWGRAVLITGVALIVASATYLVLTGNTGIRYSADHTGTVPMWTRWVPALAGLLLALLIPGGSRAATPQPPAAGRTPPYPQAVVLITAAVAFAASLRLAGGGEPAHTLLKLALLLCVPAVAFWLLRRRGDATQPGHRRNTAPQPDASAPGDAETASWRRYGPLIPVAAWFALSFTGPFAIPPSDYGRTVDPVTLLVTIAVVFLVNSLLEEVFYRRWLQSTCEAVLGRRPAIVLAALLWASWHVGIQGTGTLADDLASVFVNQGVQGLFLGYLYSKHRLMWPILTVHGLTNSAPILLGLL